MIIKRKMYFIIRGETVMYQRLHELISGDPINKKIKKSFLIINMFTIISMIIIVSILYMFSYKPICHIRNHMHFQIIYQI